MKSERAEKTIAKALRGGLPAPTEPIKLVGMEPGRLCDGCHETIRPSEERYAVWTGSAVCLRFHGECYGAWAKRKH